MYSEPLIKFNNDLVPAGRLDITPYHLQIGDCIFRVPPTQINVRQTDNINIYQGLRQRNAVLTKSGYTQTEITVQLWFNDLADINGIEVAGPGGRKYYMDGLRPMIAQFRRTPILPVFNELLNDVYDIYAVILSNLVVQTVPDYPGALEARLTLYKTTIEPYMFIPDWQFADRICWPVFRWYYQQLMQSDGIEQLSPVTTPYLTGNFGLSLLKEEALESGQIGDSGLSAGQGGVVATITSGYEIVKVNGEDRAIMPARKLAGMLGLPVEWKPPYVVIGGKQFKPYRVVSGTAWVLVRQVGETLGYTVDWVPGRITISKSGASWSAPSTSLDPYMVLVELPENIQLTHLAVALGNSFVNLNVQLYSTPCHQYLGSMERHIVATFETDSRDAVAALKQIVQTAEEYSLRYRDRLVSGFIGFHNELTSLFGIRYVMVNGLEIDTVPDFPDLFRITLSMIEFDRLQRSYERAEAIKYVDDVLKAIATVNADDITETAQACLVEEMLDAFILYPDLDLPTYSRLQTVIDLINEQRTANGLGKLSFKPYIAPGANSNPNACVDPDFYIDYSNLLS